MEGIHIVHVPSEHEFRSGYRAFQRRERRDAMYKTASFLVRHFWGKPADMADSVGVLLLTWNQAFYRYGPFDFQRLEDCITNNWPTIESFRSRDIFGYSPTDDLAVAGLFDSFLAALQLCEGKKRGTGSPVAVAKALHLLAPSFFPLWDAKIASAYGCHYTVAPADAYIGFTRRIKQLAEAVRTFGDATGGKTLLKLIDEYNYARFTKKWM